MELSAAAITLGLLDRLRLALKAVLAVQRVLSRPLLIRFLDLLLLVVIATTAIQTTQTTTVERLEAAERLATQTQTTRAVHLEAAPGLAIPILPLLERLAVPTVLGLLAVTTTPALEHLAATMLLLREHPPLEPTMRHQVLLHLDQTHLAVETARRLLEEVVLAAATATQTLHLPTTRLENLLEEQHRQHLEVRPVHLDQLTLLVRSTLLPTRLEAVLGQPSRLDRKRVTQKVPLDRRLSEVEGLVVLPQLLQLRPLELLLPLRLLEVICLR